MLVEIWTGGVGGVDGWDGGSLEGEEEGADGWTDAVGGQVDALTGRRDDGWPMQGGTGRGRGSGF